MATQSKKTKRTDRRAARARYWHSGRLAKRKIRNLVKYCGFATEADARRYWLDARTRFAGSGYKAK